MTTNIISSFTEIFSDFIVNEFNDINIKIEFLAKTNIVDTIIISAKNKITDRELFFRYQKFNPNDFINEMNFVWFTVNSSKELNNININDFLRIKMLKREQIFTLNHFSEDLKDNRIEKYFLHIREILINEMHNIILGKEWLDIPFDWDGYNK